MLGWLWQGKDNAFNQTLERLMGLRQALNPSAHSLALSVKINGLFGRVNSYFHLSSLRAMLCRFQTST